MIYYIIKGIFPLKNKSKNINVKLTENIESNNDIIIFNTSSRKTKKKKNKVISHPVKKNLSKSEKSNKKNKKKENNKDNKSNDKEKRKKKKSKNKAKKRNKETIHPNSVTNTVKNNFISISSNAQFNNIEKKENDPEEKEKKVYDAFELNNLGYEEAICHDQRTFLRTYWDILSREHKIIFTFFIWHDYNLLNIKYARFIFLFANDMAMNVFFFTDESMHKIFLNYGKYNFIQQIPQIIYTTIISQLLEVFLCFLSLTDKYIYEIKNLNKPDNIQLILKILKCIKIKLICFYVFTFIFFWFYWYTVAVFCAVYENTQIIFLKDSLFSFLLGIIYPIVLYLIPSALRILSLRNPKMHLTCIYKLSDVIPFF